MKRVIEISDNSYKLMCNRATYLRGCHSLTPEIEILANSTPLENEYEELKAEIRYNGLYNEQIEDIIDRHIKELDNGN